MKKKLIAIVMALSMVLAFSACGESAETQSTS